MNEVLQPLISLINSATNGNQTYNSIILMTLMGSMLYSVKGHYRKITGFMKKHATTTLILTDVNPRLYRLVGEAVREEVEKKNLRTLRIIPSDAYGYIKGLGRGEHLLKLRGRWVKTTITEDITGTTVIGTTYITILGRSNEYFDDLVQTLIREDQSSSETHLFKVVRQGGRYSIERSILVPDYTLENMILPLATTEALIKCLDDFTKNEEKYARRGVPYHLGILLHGKPGTGKSALIKAITNKLKRNLVHCDTVGEAIHSLSTLHGKSFVVVLEELDTRGIANRKLNIDEIEPEEEEENGNGEQLLGTLLTALSGVMENPGRVFITTTNKPIEDLDEALIRPGRIDLRLELKNLANDDFVRMVERFDYEVPAGTEFMEEVSPSRLQNSLMSASSVEDILTEYEVKE